MIDITPIIGAIASLIGAIVTAVVVPYIKAKTTTEQQTQLNKWAKIAVTAAEQLFPNPGSGSEKKAYVLAFLASHGFTVDMDAVDAIIESAVYELGNGSISLIEGVIDDSN